MITTQRFDELAILMETNPTEALKLAIFESLAKYRWQPIKTAPMDGTKIDIFVGNTRYTDCSYNQFLNHWETKIWDGTNRTIHVDGYSLWMPIPPNMFNNASTLCEPFFDTLI